MPEYVYVVVAASRGVRVKGGRLPHFGSFWVKERAYRSLDLADEVAREWMSYRGKFWHDDVEFGSAGYVMRAWSNFDHVVWVERLVLDGVS